MTAATRAIFLSYASEDAEAAARICEALRAAGIEVWFDKSELRGGDAWNAQIKKQIHDCALFVPLISAHANARIEGYFRREWKLATRRLLDRADDAVFLVPVVVDDTREVDARVPEEFFQAHWTRLPGGEVPPAFGQRVRQLLGLDRDSISPAQSAASVTSEPNLRNDRSMRTRGMPQLTRVGIALIALLLVLVAGTFWYYRSTSERPGAQPSSATESPSLAAGPDEKSIAVLPFADMSETKDQEYFSDGLSEELIDHLAQIRDLKVIARSSTFAFKGTNEDVRTVASKLGVTNVLQGSVRKAGNRLRITAQLIRASDGVLLWSESYDRKLVDVFELQDEISATVAKALNAKLNMARSFDLCAASDRVVNIEAYNLMLQGNYVYMRGNKGDEAKAVELFQLATTHDPQYALAWAKLSRALAWQGYIGDLTGDEAVSRSRRAADRALEIDPNCAEAYYARGNILRVLSGEWTAALSDYDKAAALDPNGQIGNEAEGNTLLLKAQMSGQFDAMIDWSLKWLESSPLDAGRMHDLAWVYQIAGDLEASAEAFRRVLEVNPNYSSGPALYGLTLLLMGKHDEALAAADIEPDQASRLIALTNIYWASGRRAESDATLGALELKYPDRKAYDIAAAHAYRGDATAAFSWLDRAYLQRRGSLEYLKVDPLFQRLHRDPRFGAFLRKAKLAG